MNTLTTIDKISITLHQKLYDELNADQRGSVEKIFFAPISELKSWLARYDFNEGF